MKIITAKAAQKGPETLASPAEELVLIGPPRRLKGTLVLENKADAPVFVQDVALRPAASKKGATLPETALRVGANLASGETRSCTIRQRLPDTTPPGEHTLYMDVGGKQVPVRCVVQARCKVKLSPKRVEFFGTAPNTTHTAEIQAVNMGNVPVEVRASRHVTARALDDECRSLSLAARTEGGYETTLDTYVHELKQETPGWLIVALKEAGQTLGVGLSMLLHLTLTLPADTKPDRIYQGEIRIFDRLLAYVIHPAPKQTRKKTTGRKTTTKGKTSPTAKGSRRGRKPREI